MQHILGKNRPLRSGDTWTPRKTISGVSKVLFFPYRYKRAREKLSIRKSSPQIPPILNLCKFLQKNCQSTEVPRQSSLYAPFQHKTGSCEKPGIEFRTATKREKRPEIRTYRLQTLFFQKTFTSFAGQKSRQSNLATLTFFRTSSEDGL